MVLRNVGMKAIFTIHQGLTMKKTIYFYLAAGWLAACAMNAIPLLAEEKASAPKVADASPAKSGLGGLFAESLKEMLKSGTLFAPNGVSAGGVDSATPGAGKKFKLNFNNAPIDQVLKFLSDMTNKLVLKTPEVQGQFTVMNPNEVTKEEAMKIIDAAFRFQDIAFQETDQMIVVLPLAQAKLKMGGVFGKEGEGESASRVQSKIIELKYSNPSQIKEALAPLVVDVANIIVDDRTKTLVLTDTAANIERLETIIKQLDKETTLEGVVIQVFRLRYLNSNEMSRSLSEMINNLVTAKYTGESDRRKVDRIVSMCEVIADRTTNSLIIVAPEDIIKSISDFITKMDVSTIQNMTTRTIALKNANATEVAQGLQQFTSSRRSEVYRPVIFADSRTNSVVINAYPEDVESIVKVLEDLDQKQSYEKITRVFTLENGDAIVISQMIKQLITGENPSSRRSYWGYYGGRNQDESQMQIVEDQRLNALIVSARPSDFPMIEELIKSLDLPMPQSKEEPRVYPVKHVRATDLAQMLTQIFSSQTNNMDYYFGYGNNQQEITGLSGKVKTIADSTTNSLIVIAASPRAFGVIEKMIEQLDKESTEFGTTKVFSLKNASAEYLAEQLNSLFEEDTRRQGNRGFFWYMNQQSGQDDTISNMIGNVRIVSETRTNSLMVTTSSQYFPAIDGLIKDLDRSISQILVEILIVEIIDVNNNQLGINWGDKVSLNVEGTLEAPVGGVNLDRAALLSTAKYDAVLDILGSNSKTNVLARPNILTGDNQPAFVEVTNRIPRLGQISQGNVTTTQNIQYEEVGLKLDVSPHINDATTCTMDVNLETGQILSQFALVTSNGSAPAFSRRTVKTRLTIEKEETAVLSGVIDTSFTESEDGVPGLMRIPIIGSLFKSKGKKQNKTELLTFITPYILADQQDRLQILERQRKRIDMYKQFNAMMKDIKVNVGVKNGENEPVSNPAANQDNSQGSSQASKQESKQETKPETKPISKRISNNSSKKKGW